MGMRFLLLMAICGLFVLSGCNSTDTVLQPTPADTSAKPADSSAIAPISDARIRLAPVVGAPVEAVTAMTKRLSLRARERGIGLVRSDETGETHFLKGYFSAFTEAQTTTVVYVWDILDTSGNRLHRFQGQENVPTTAGAQDWQSVPPETMERIADLTIESLGAWLTAPSS